MGRKSEYGLARLSAQSLTKYQMGHIPFCSFEFSSKLPWLLSEFTYSLFYQWGKVL